MTNPFDAVEMSCTAEIGGQRVEVIQVIPEAAYQDPSLRKVVEEALRQKLMLAILEKWTPKIRVRR